MAKKTPSSKSHTHLLSVSDLSTKQVAEIFRRAKTHLGNAKSKSLAGKNIGLLFFEDSTRTRTSFEIAAKELGAHVININIATSSVNKGETYLDTAKNLAAMGVDILVVRHPQSGVPAQIAREIHCHVVNAGDGCHEHPTQALLDAFTIQQKLGKIENVSVAICGDILHSRVARSNARLLTMLGAKVTLIAPPTLMPHTLDIPKIHISYDLQKSLHNVDVVMMLRLQKERMNGAYMGSLREFAQIWGLNHEKLNGTKLILHPGPINRGLEMSSALIDDMSKQNAILDQVTYGVAVRKAVFEMVI